jgi:hypothetical protein
MAYGKNRDYLKTNFVQQARRTMTRSKGERKGAPYYVNTYKPPTHGTDIIRLIPGQFQVPLIDPDKQDYLYDDNGQIVQNTLAYWPHIEHYHGTKKKSAICSAGPLSEFKGKGDPCVACDWFWWEWRKRNATGNKNSPRSMSRRDMWAFTVLVQAPFHKVEDLDEHGNVRMNTNTDKPYFSWRKCTGRGCEMCAAKKESKKGHIQHWPMGRDHFNTLLDYAVQLGKHCRVCSSQDCITELAWVCQHDDCGDAVIEMATTQLTDEQLDKMTSDMVTCPHCKRRTYLKCLFECSVCAMANPPREGERATLFDVDLEVKRVEDPSGDSNRTSLSIIRALGPRPIDSIYGEDLRKSLDLPKIYTPSTLERQSALFDLPPADEAPERTPVNSRA